MLHQCQRIPGRSLRLHPGAHGHAMLSPLMKMKIHPATPVARPCCSHQTWALQWLSECCGKPLFPPTSLFHGCFCPVQQRGRQRGPQEMGTLLLPRVEKLARSSFTRGLSSDVKMSISRATFCFRQRTFKRQTCLKDGQFDSHEKSVHWTRSTFPLLVLLPCQHIWDHYIKQAWLHLHYEIQSERDHNFRHMQMTDCLDPDAITFPLPRLWLRCCFRKLSLRSLTLLSPTLVALHLISLDCVYGHQSSKLNHCASVFFRVRKRCFRTLSEVIDTVKPSSDRFASHVLGLRLWAPKRLAQSLYRSVLESNHPVSELPVCSNM